MLTCSMGALACVFVLFGAAPDRLWIQVTNCTMTVWNMHNFRDFGGSPGISALFDLASYLYLLTEGCFDASC